LAGHRDPAAPSQRADRHGIAQAESELVSATKATLNALNRYLSQLDNFA
jgi:hypothetical protein